MLGEQVHGPLLGLAEQGGDLVVDDPLGRLRMRGAADLFAAKVHGAATGEPDRAKPLTHAELPDHPVAWPRLFIVVVMGVRLGPMSRARLPGLWPSLTPDGWRLGMAASCNAHAGAPEPDDHCSGSSGP